MDRRELAFEIDSSLSRAELETAMLLASEAAQRVLLMYRAADGGQVKQVDVLHARVPQIDRGDDQ